MTGRGGEAIRSLVKASLMVSYTIGRRGQHEQHGAYLPSSTSHSATCYACPAAGVGGAALIRAQPRGNHGAVLQVRPATSYSRWCRHVADRLTPGRAAWDGGRVLGLGQ